MGRHHPPQFVVDIAREFHGSGFGEMHAIRGTQPTNLAFEVRTLHGVTSLFVDKAVPDIDVSDAGFFSALAIKLVEIAHIAASISVPRMAGSPTHTIGTPLLLSAAIMSSMRLA